MSGQPARALPWAMAWRLARRDLSARFRGLRLLVVCLFLGVGALAATASLTSAVTRALRDHGRLILGGDVQVTVWQRDLAPAERAAMAQYGALSGGTRMQAMASSGASSGSDGAAVPVELKAVDARWPLVGRLALADGRQVGAPAPGSVWLAEGGAARLGVGVGGVIRIAGQPLRVAGIIADEPDRLAEGFTLGQVVIVADGFPQAAGLTAPGAMYRTRVRLACRAGCDAAAVADALRQRFPNAGLEIRTRDKAAPGADSFISRMGDFLVLVGLAALMIAGLGIGGGTASYLEARMGAIATLKVLGATSRDITRIYLLQIGAAALVGALAGLVVGVAAVPLLARALAGVLPVAQGLVIDPAALGRAAGWGMLVAMVFAAPPLAAARAFPAMALMRARVGAVRAPWRAVALPVGLGLAGIVALAFAGAGAPLVTAWFLAGAAGLMAGLAGLGWAIRRGAAALPRPRGALRRLALANLHRPGAQTGRLVMALGFGLAAFVLLAVVQTSLDANIAARVPAKAPDYFVLDLQPGDEAAFRAAVAGVVPGARWRSVPALRGAILAYGPAGRMQRVADMASIPDGAWALKGERGLTFADDVPEGNVLTEGQWWPHGYAGPPLVSVDEKLAEAVGLHVGDTISIGLLGVERPARIASLRRIDWDSFGFNYVLVFSPNALAGAPYKLAATISLPHGTGATPRGALLRRLAQGWPQVSVIEVGPLLTQARGLLAQVANAILAAASVAVLAGIAVLLGALAAARAARLYDTVILRLLGASQRQVLGLLLLEYGALAAVLGVVALGLGGALGWVIVVRLFDFAFLPDWGRVLMVLGGGLAVVLGFALAGTLGLLKVRPAAALREL